MLSLLTLFGKFSNSKKSSFNTKFEKLFVLNFQQQCPFTNKSFVFLLPKKLRLLVSLRTGSPSNAKLNAKNCEVLFTKFPLTQSRFE